MTFTKDPDSTLDYTFDWSAWLSDGEVIADQTITMDSGLTKDSVSVSDTAVTVWISGGLAGLEYSVACKITTDNSPARIDERTMTIKVANQ